MSSQFNSGRDNLPTATPVPAGAPAPSEESKPWRPELQGLNPPLGGDLSGAAEEQVFDERELGLAVGPNRLKASLSRANLVLFGLFLAGVALVAFMSLRKGPQSTTAAEQQAEKNAHSAIDRFLQSQSPAAGPTAPAAQGRSGGLGKFMEDTRGLVEMFFNFTSKKQVPLEDLKTNPFRFASAKPEADPKSVQEQQAAEARAKLVETVKADFARLKLQTIVNGPAGKTAMINSSVVKVGDTISQFKVVDIRPRQVLLTREDIEFTLEISY